MPFSRTNPKVTKYCSALPSLCSVCEMGLRSFSSRFVLSVFKIPMHFHPRVLIADSSHSPLFPYLSPFLSVIFLSSLSHVGKKRTGYLKLLLNWAATLCARNTQRRNKVRASSPRYDTNQPYGEGICRQMESRLQVMFYI